MAHSEWITIVGGTFTQTTASTLLHKVVTSDSFRFDTALATGLSENTRGAVRDAVRSLPDRFETTSQSSVPSQGSVSPNRCYQLSLSVVTARISSIVAFVLNAVPE